MSGRMHGEGLVAHEFAGAPDRMAETERLLLAREARLACLRLVAGEGFQFLGLAALGEGSVQFVRDVEMILDHGLVAARDENELLDSSRARLVHHMLHHRAVDHAHHLLRHRLGGRQETGAETGDGEDGFADALH